VPSVKTEKAVRAATPALAINVIPNAFVLARKAVVQRVVTAVPKFID
jgi:hypothetical protein